MAFSAEELRDILQKNFNDVAREFYGIHDLEQALREPNVNVIDALFAFIEQKIESRDPLQYRIIHGLTNVLFSLTIRQELTEEQAERLFSLVEKGRYQSYDDEDLYRVINFLDVQKYAQVLIKFVEKFVREKKRRDWRLIAYAVIGRLLGKQFQLPRELVEELIEEALKEEDSHRRDQMIFLSGRLAENQRLYV